MAKMAQANIQESSEEKIPGRSRQQSKVATAAAKKIPERPMIRSMRSTSVNSVALPGYFCVAKAIFRMSPVTAPGMIRLKKFPTSVRRRAVHSEKWNPCTARRIFQRQAPNTWAKP